MTAERLIREIHAAVSRGVDAGLVVSGSLVAIEPRTPGLCEVRAARTPDGPAVAYRLSTHAVVPPSPERESAPEPARAYAERPSAGEVCAFCGGSRLEWRGACKTCADCGTSGGCS